MTYITEYKVFFSYLDFIWQKTKNGSLGGLLGGMSLLPDGSPADPVNEKAWSDAISRTTINGNTNIVPCPLAYQTGIAFLTQWLEIGYDSDIAQVCLDLQKKKYLHEWNEAVMQTVNGKADIALRFE